MKTWILQLNTTDVYLHFCETIDQAQSIYKFECHQNIEEPFYNKIGLYETDGTTKKLINEINF